MRQEMYQIILLQEVDENLAQQKKLLSQLTQQHSLRELGQQLEYWREKLAASQRIITEKQAYLQKNEMDLVQLNQAITKEKQDIYQENAYSDKHLLSILDVVKRDEEQADLIENKILQAMDELETRQKQYGLIKEKLELVEKSYNSQKAESEKKIREIDSTLQELTRKRMNICAKVSKKLLREYERKKSGLKGKLVVKLAENSICAGCHVKININDWKKISAGGVVRCEKCGRYLIKDM